MTLYSLLGNKVLMNMLISLAKYFTRDILTLTVTNNTLDLLATPNSTSYIKENDLTIP